MTGAHISRDTTVRVLEISTENDNPKCRDFRKCSLRLYGCTFKLTPFIIENCFPSEQPGLHEISKYSQGYTNSSIWIEILPVEIAECTEH